jgi:hypothetical protein
LKSSATNFFPATFGVVSRSARVPVWLRNGILLLVLALAVLKANWRLEQMVDLDGTDETQYLAIGLKMPHDGPPDAHSEVFFAPLYSTWYLALSKLQPDPIRLVGLNFRLLSILLAWTLFTLLRRAGCSAVASALAAFFLITHDLSLYPATRSIHFAVLCLAGGIVFALRASTRVRQCCALALGATCAAFARPEYSLLAVAALGAAAVLYALPRFRENPTDWKFLAGAFAVALALVIGFGAPIGAGNDRSFIAFSQHFSLKYIQRHPSDIDPWWNGPVILAQVFGPSHTLLQALRANPHEFLVHLGSNFEEICARLPPLGVSHRNFLLPDGHRWKMAESLLLGGVFVALIFVARKRLGANLRWFFHKAPAIPLFMLGAVGLAFAGMILTSTADRYFFPFVFLGLFFLVTLLFRSDAPAKEPSAAFVFQPLWLGGFALAILGLTPAFSFLDQNITSTRAVLAELGKHSFRDGTGFVEALGMKRMEIFLPRQLHFVHPMNKTGSFKAFLENGHVGVIHETPYLSHSRNFASDAEWNDFLADPAKFGFSEIPLPFQETLFVRDASLAPEKSDATVQHDANKTPHRDYASVVR